MDRYAVASSVLLAVLLISGCVSNTPAGTPTPGMDGPKPNGFTLAWTEKTVPSKPVIIFQTTSIDGNCAPQGVPDVTVVSGPSNGKVTFRKMKILPNVTQKSKCYWVQVPGVKAFYTPNPGFVGKDKVKLRTKLIEGGFGISHITIEVAK